MRKRIIVTVIVLSLLLAAVGYNAARATIVTSPERPRLALALGQAENGLTVIAPQAIATYSTPPKELTVPVFISAIGNAAIDLATVQVEIANHVTNVATSTRFSRRAGVRAMFLML